MWFPKQCGISRYYYFFDQPRTVTDTKQQYIFSVQFQYYPPPLVHFSGRANKTCAAVQHKTSYMTRDPRESLVYIGGCLITVAPEPRDCCNRGTVRKRTISYTHGSTSVFVWPLGYD